VPVERIELPTFGLQNRCSTAELNRLIHLDRQRRPGNLGFARRRTCRRGRRASNIRVVRRGLQGRNLSRPASPRAFRVRCLAMISSGDTLKR
jgi:hypothetical protein